MKDRAINTFLTQTIFVIQHRQKNWSPKSTRLNINKNIDKKSYFEFNIIKKIVKKKEIISI